MFTVGEGDSPLVYPWFEEEESRSVIIIDKNLNHVHQQLSVGDWVVYDPKYTIIHPNTPRKVIHISNAHPNDILIADFMRCQSLSNTNDRRFIGIIGAVSGIPRDGELRSSTSITLRFYRSH